MRLVLASLAMVALLAAGCSAGHKAARPDQPATLPDPVEAAAPAAAAPGVSSPAATGQGITNCGNGKSHKGTLDVPKSELEGTASYYGEQYDGRQTASGELFDMKKFSAAHRTLRLGTLVRVTNLDNGRSLEVCVNDRGPYAKERVLDLSYAAAKELGVLAEGTAPVRIEIVGKK